MSEQPSNSPKPAGRSRRGCLGCLAVAAAWVALLVVVDTVLGLHELVLPVLRDSVGVVYVEGPIYESQSVVRSIRRLRKSRAIKAIVVRLDSPGGAVGASEEIWREVKRAADENRKPVVASMGNAAASGAYYIAAATDEIWSNNSTVTGSIGVIAAGVNVSDLLGRLGIQPEVVKSGQLKDTGSPFRPPTEQETALLQGVVFDLYRQFFLAVLSARHKQIDDALHKDPGALERVVSAGTTKRPGRRLELEAFTTGSMAKAAGATEEAETALRELADGRILTGEQALAVGLVDRIGSLDDAISRAGKMAGLGDDPPVVERRPASGLPALLGAAMRAASSEFARGDATVEFRAPAAR